MGLGSERMSESLELITVSFIIYLKRMTDEERFQDFPGFIQWQQEGLDIEKHHCLFISFGVNMKFQFTQIRRVIVIFS